VLTVNDAGGVLRAVRHGETGLVADPTAESLGAAMQELVAEPRITACMGEAGRERLRRLGMSWPVIIERLLA
jgi:glycosyltransferase involved in cell wall biosynthesis